MERILFISYYHVLTADNFNTGNVDPKPTNLAGSEGAGGVSNCGSRSVGDECNSGMSGSSIDTTNNQSSNFSPQGNMQSSSSTMNNGGKDTSNSDVQKLQEQLNDIKEQVSLK